MECLIHYSHSLENKSAVARAIDFFPLPLKSKILGFQNMICIFMLSKLVLNKEGSEKALKMYFRKVQLYKFQFN